MKIIKAFVEREGKCIFLFLCCLAWIGISAQTSFSQFRNTITGFVFDTQRNPIGQISVELQNELNQTLLRTRTDNSGRFFFSGISSGRFNIRVLPSGTNFEEQTQEVEITNLVRPGGISTSESAQKDFYLRVRRDARAGSSINGTLFAQEVPTDAQKFYNKALDRFDGGKNEEGIQELLKAIKAFPDYFLALERLGREYIKQQKYEEARAAFIKTVSVNQRSFSGWYGLCYAVYALKMPDVAIEAGQNAVKLEPSSVDANLLLGISLRQAQRYQDSEKTLLLAKKLAKGQSPDVHWNLALLYNHNLKRYKDAADELELYLKSSPNDPKTESIKKLVAQLREKSASN